MSDEIQDDVAEFWNKYREEHGIEKNIMLIVIDIDGSMSMAARDLADLFISHKMSKRKFEGKSPLQPKKEKEI